jgi:hypothetical protein
MIVASLLKLMFSADLARIFWICCSAISQGIISAEVGASTQFLCRVEKVCEKLSRYGIISASLTPIYSLFKIY